MRMPIFLQPTEDHDYAPKRKALSSAFFKAKMQRMTSIIKAVVMKYLQDTKDQEVIDLPTLTSEIQSNIILNISVGQVANTTMVPWENEDGTIG